MRERTLTIVAGAFAGVLACAVLALPDLLPRAMADEAPAISITKTAQEIFRKPIDGNAFARLPEHEAEPWVDMDVQSERVVRKIAYGRTTFVRIMTTSTGVYSSDGLASAHVLYPGIRATHAGGAGATTVVAMLEGGGWLRVSPGRARSFQRVTPIEPGVPD